MEKVHYIILSPDGFPTWREPYETTKNDFEQHSQNKLTEFVNRFSRQGYYSSNQRRIPLDELKECCEIRIIEDGQDAN